MSLLNSLRLSFLSTLLFCMSAFAATVNINSASKEQLADALIGVGEAKAAAIVAFRSANGPFRKIADLAKVEGIGPHIVDINRDAIILDSQSERKKP